MNFHCNSQQGEPKTLNSYLMETPLLLLYSIEQRLICKIKYIIPVSDVLTYKKYISKMHIKSKSCYTAYKP